MDYPTLWKIVLIPTAAPPPLDILQVCEHSWLLTLSSRAMLQRMFWLVPFLHYRPTSPQNARTATPAPVGRRKAQEYSDSLDKENAWSQLIEWYHPTKKLILFNVFMYTKASNLQLAYDASTHIFYLWWRLDSRQPLSEAGCADNIG